MDGTNHNRNEVNTMTSRYPQEVVERMILNLYRNNRTEEAYDAIFDCPELTDELEADDLTCAQLLERIQQRNSTGGE